LADKLWEVAFDGVPQELEVNVVIFVNQLLPHTNNSCPRDLGIVFSLYSGDSIRRFADDFDEALKCQSSLARFREINEGKPSRHLHCLLAVNQHVPQALA